MTEFADIFANRPVLADGAMGTVLYARGIFINRCYDELNLSDPGLILSIHEEYLQAGAEILETNTFGANRFRLSPAWTGRESRRDQRRGREAGPPGRRTSQRQASGRGLGGRIRRAAWGSS